MEKDGHIVAICESATDVAVDRLKDYDLILLDIMMPDVDGFMFCKKIRGLVDCPILFLTAKVFTREQIYEAVFGFDGDSDDLTIATHIRNIRSKLAGYGIAPINTVWGVGYRWERQN